MDAHARLQIPDGTQQKLQTYRRRVWRVKLIEALAAAVFGLTLSYLIVFVVDRFQDTPAWLRGTLLASATLAAAVWLPAMWHRWFWQTRRFEQVARLLKHRFPRLADRMLGVIELASSDVEQQRSYALCQAALQQVDQDLKDHSFDDAVPWPRHRQWLAAVAVPLALAGLILALVPAAGRNALARWLQPWRAVPRYTFAQLNDLPNELIVPYAEPFELTAQLAEQTAWAPNEASAQVGQQQAVQATLDDGQYGFELRAQKQDQPLELSVGDARRTIAVLPKLRPELTDLTAEIRLPDYLQYEQPERRDARGGTLTVLTGSRVSLQAAATRPLQQADLNGQAASLTSQGLTTQPATVKGDAQWQLDWRDQLGLTAKRPLQLTIQTTEDQPPTVVCSELSRQQVVLSRQVLSFAVRGDDDFGVKELGLQWDGVPDPLENPVPASGNQVIRGGSPTAKELPATATFCAAREGIEPQTIQLRLYVDDYLPGRERVYSPPYTLFVLSEAEHANWLTEQMRRWARSAQEVFETEHQLYETNRELRALTAEQLDQTETRQRLETQAAAEAANGRQLAAVSGAGKQLIREAARNDQFDAETMEGLAQMVKRLDALAGERMPSVVDLLKKAASAKPAKDGQSPSGDDDASPSPPAAQVGHHRDTQNQSPADGNEQEDEQEKKDEEDSPPPTPAIVDVESSMNKPQANKQAGKKKPASPAGPGSFGLPSTTVLGGGVPQPEPEQEEEEDESDVQEKLDEAIQQQQDILAEFAAVAAELQRILDSLEGSTFVKRLKAASRNQLEIATQLGDTLAAQFGARHTTLSEKQQQAATVVAEREMAERQKILYVKQDLEAYYARVQQGKFLTVIEDMDELQVAGRMEKLSELVTENLHGQAIAHAEYWADTFDRWAEQLVGPGQPSSSSSAKSPQGGSLSPSIVLDIMKLLEQEVGLREETRAAEQAREALEPETYAARAGQLAETQGDVVGKLQKTVSEIHDLELEQGVTFSKELEMLNRVGAVMMEASEILAEPHTGSRALAAETEAIELLLQVQRKQPPKQKSKGKAGQSPNGGSEGDTDESALALIGRGDEQLAGHQERQIKQATGVSGGGYPAEYRAGLDEYFGRIEQP